MRKLAWLTLFAVAALFFSAQQSAFAHANHHHAPQVQSAVEIPAEHAALDVTLTDRFEAHVTATEPQSHKCPHGESADCAFCCACAGSASVAIATTHDPVRDVRIREAAIVPADAYIVRQAVLDLSRPPKSFA